MPSGQFLWHVLLLACFFAAKQQEDFTCRVHHNGMRPTDHITGGGRFADAERTQAAEKATTETIAFMIRHTSGVICCSLSVSPLPLPPPPF